MKTIKKFIISCIIILTSCQNPTIPAVQESITAPEITIEETMERTITMNPIPDALGYLFKNRLLKGITAETDRANSLSITPKADINGKLYGVVLDGFFTKDGKKYFSFTDRYQDETEANIEKELYFEQTGLAVKEIEIMPDKPVSAGMTLGSFGVFEFIKYSYENVDYNKLSFSESGAIISTAKSFDSAVLTNKGILFSQEEKLSRDSGLWYMGNEQRGGPTRIGDYQIIY